MPSMNISSASHSNMKGGSVNVFANSKAISPSKT